MLENPYKHGPFGAKGVGEMPIDGPAPAVINALRHAGFDLRAIPATPERRDGCVDTIDQRTPRTQRRIGTVVTSVSLVSFVLNRRATKAAVHPMKRLLDVLREDCALTGTKEGCGEGECGACTVLVDGAPVNSCLVPVAQVDGARVTTIEGLGGRHPLQRAFVEHGGAQCGICTPGMILAAVALGKHPTLDQMKTGLAGNLCRCTGYSAIYRSIAATTHGKNRRRSEGTAETAKTAKAPRIATKRKNRRVRKDRRGADRDVRRIAYERIDLLKSEKRRKPRGYCRARTCIARRHASRSQTTQRSVGTDHWRGD